MFFPSEVYYILVQSYTLSYSSSRLMFFFELMFDNFIYCEENIPFFLEIFSITILSLILYFIGTDETISDRHAAIVLAWAVLGLSVLLALMCHSSFLFISIFFSFLSSKIVSATPPDFFNLWEFRDVVDFHVPVTPIMYGIVSLHDFIVFFLLLILCIVVYMLCCIVNFFVSHSSLGNRVFLNNISHVCRNISSFEGFGFLYVLFHIWVCDLLVKEIVFLSWLKISTNSWNMFMGVGERMYDAFLDYPFNKRASFASYFINHLHPYYVDYIKYRYYRISHSLELEIIWTILPTVILIAIAVPSFTLLYAMDEIVNPSLTIKVIGHQWFWTYEYSDYFFDWVDYFNTVSRQEECSIIYSCGYEHLYPVSHFAVTNVPAYKLFLRAFAYHANRTDNDWMDYLMESMEWYD